MRDLKLGFFVAAMFSAVTAIAQTNTVYPYRDPYLATLTSQIMPVTRALQTFEIPPLPGRKSIRIVGERSALQVSAYVQPRPAPLVFVLPGTGGDPNERLARWLAERWIERGYSALVMTSPLNWRFVVGQSRTGIFGYAPEDDRDLYRTMVQAKAYAERRLGLRATSVATTGYSLGAKDAAFISAIDRAQGALGIHKSVLLNPPLDVPYAIATIDRLNAAGSQWTFQRRELVKGRAISAGRALLARDPADPNYFVGLDKQLPLTHAEAAWAVGAFISNALAWSIYGSQFVNDLHVLRAQPDENTQAPREMEAARYGFQAWDGRFAVPYFSGQLGLSRDELEGRSNWPAIESSVVSDRGAWIIHSSDDFLTRPADLERLRSRMGARVRVIEGGGHCGGFWWSGYRAALTEAIQSR